jgi:hypothetical protein
VSVFTTLGNGGVQEHSRLRVTATPAGGSAVGELTRRSPTARFDNVQQDADPVPTVPAHRWRASDDTETVHLIGHRGRLGTSAAGVGRAQCRVEGG